MVILGNNNISGYFSLFPDPSAPTPTIPTFSIPMILYNQMFAALQLGASLTVQVQTATLPTSRLLLQMMLQSHQQIIDNTASFQTMLRISNDTIMESESLKHILEQIPLPSTDPLDRLGSINWIISAVGKMEGDEAVELVPNREEGLTALGEEVKALFTLGLATNPSSVGRPTIVESKACY